MEYKQYANFKDLAQGMYDEALLEQRDGFENGYDGNVIGFWRKDNYDCFSMIFTIVKDKETGEFSYSKDIFDKFYYEDENSEYLFNSIEFLDRHYGYCLDKTIMETGFHDNTKTQKEYFMSLFDVEQFANDLEMFYEEKMNSKND